LIDAHVLCQSFDKGKDHLNVVSQYSNTLLKLEY